MKNVFYILKNDRQAAISLLVLFIAISLIVIELFTSNKPNGEQKQEAETVEQKSNMTGNDNNNEDASRAVHLQPFDPNTADSTVLLGLGLQPWQVRSIYKYRAAGGAYTCPEDFARLYGLTAKKFRELLPYIRIGEDYRPASEVYGKRPAYATRSSASDAPTATEAQPHSTKLKAGQTVSLANADTTALQQVPGIGPYFARRIVRYRDQLGGYVSKDQLLEIQDFPESALPYLDLSSPSVHKLNVNKATSEQLRKHPYITFAMAREIQNYRRLRGNIHDLSDLSLLPSFTKETIAKLRPYVEY